MKEHESEQKPVLGELVEEGKARKPLSTMMVIAVGAFMVFYLLNLSFGFVEFVPDTVPILGNLDEVVATSILLGCLSHFGIELPWLRKYATRSGKQSGSPSDIQGRLKG